MDFISKRLFIYRQIILNIIFPERMSFFLMRMICFTITQSQQRAMQLSAAFRYAIFTPKQEELYVSALMQKGYFAEWNYVVVMMDICDRLENEKEEIFYVPI